MKQSSIRLFKSTFKLPRIQSAWNSMKVLLVLGFLNNLIQNLHSARAIFTAVSHGLNLYGSFNCLIVLSLAVVSHSWPLFVCSRVMTQLIWIMWSDVNKWGSDTNVSSQWLEFHTTEHKRPPQLPHPQPCVSVATLLIWETDTNNGRRFPLLFSFLFFLVQQLNSTRSKLFTARISGLLVSWSHVVLF